MINVNNNFLRTRKFELIIQYSSTTTNAQNMNKFDRHKHSYQPTYTGEGRENMRNGKESL